jgi:hypothetical protein
MNSTLSFDTMIQHALVNGNISFSSRVKNNFAYHLCFLFRIRSKLKLKLETFGLLGSCANSKLCLHVLFLVV